MNNTFNFGRNLTIDELRKFMAFAVTMQFKLFGQMPATFVCIGENGTVQLIANEPDCAKFANDCRALCIAENASVAIFACEALLSRKEQQECGEPRKVVLVRIELAGGISDLHCYPIVRQSSGHSQIGPREILPLNVLTDGLSDFLPQGKLDAIDRIFAAAYFQNDPRVTRFN